MNFLSNRLAQRLPFFYGYLMLPVAMVMQVGTSPGQTFAVSAFTPALLVSLGLSESRLALAYMLGTLLAAVPLSAIGPISDRFGLRWTSLVVTVALASTCLFASTVRSFSGLLVAFFLLRFLGQGSMSLLASNTTAMWFRNRIGRVSAIISVGTSVAFAWVPQWLSESIAVYGWRTTYQGIGLILAIVLVPLLVLIFRDRPEDVNQSLDGRRPMMPVDGGDPANEDTSAVATETSFNLGQVTKTASFFILGLTSTVWALTGTGVVFYLFTLCSDRGMAEGTAADLFKTFGLSMLILQFGGSVAADYVPLNRLLGVGASMLTAGLAVLWMAQTAWQMHGFALLFGGGQGMAIAVTGVVWVRYYGREHLGNIRGWVWCATVAGSGCGPLIMGQIKDRFGSYDPAIVVFIAMMLPLTVTAWFVRPPAETLASRSSP
jgi:MFS family permease